MSKHEHWCKPCGKKIFKWGVILYAVHWVLHAVVLVLWPALGVLLLGLL